MNKINDDKDYLYYFHCYHCYQPIEQEFSSTCLFFVSKEHLFENLSIFKDFYDDEMRRGISNY